MALQLHPSLSQEPSGIQLLLSIDSQYQFLAFAAIKGWTGCSSVSVLNTPLPRVSPTK